MAELAQEVNGATKAEPSNKSEETPPTPTSWRKRLSQVLDSANLAALQHQHQQANPQHQTGRLGQKLATWQERERQGPEQPFGRKVSSPSLNSRASMHSILSRSRHTPEDGTEKMKAASGSHILPYSTGVGEAAARPLLPCTTTRPSSPRLATGWNCVHPEENRTTCAAPANAISAAAATTPESSPSTRAMKPEIPGTQPSERPRDRFFSFSGVTEGEKRKSFASPGRHDHQQPRVPVHPVYARIGLRVNSPNFTVRIGLVNIDDGPVCVQVDVFTSVGTVLEAMLRSGVLKRFEDDADIDEDTEWGIWVDGLGSPEEGKFLRLTDMPFTPDDPLTYTLRKTTDRPKSSKLPNVLGISDKDMLRHIRDQVAQEAQISREKDLISTNAKLEKFFGVPGQRKPKTSVVGGSEQLAEASEISLDSTDEDPGEQQSPAGDMATQLELNDSGTAGGERDQSEAAPHIKGETVTVEPLLEADGECCVSTAVPDEVSRTLSITSLYGAERVTPKGEKYKRTGKLADFFGVQGEKEVTVIRNTLRLEYSDAKKLRRREAKTENTAGQSVLRVYFGNETYKSLQVTTETTAAQVVSMILEKMMIKDSAEGYGIFEVAKDGIMRHLVPSESPFEVMRHWQGGETFMFKKVTFDRETESAKKKLRLPVKRAAKLAGFFGVDTGVDHAQAATVPPAEFSELLSVLNAGKDDQLDKEITESRQRTVQVRNKGKVSKEGWLYLEGVCDGKPAHLENCWCQIKNNVLLVQTNVSKNESVAPDRNHGISVPLDQCVVDGPAPSMSHPGKFRFTVTAMRGKMEQIFVATTQVDVEAWVNVLQAAVKSAKNNMSLADFEFHKVLGRGQYGKVLLCSQHSTSKVYAVKVLDKVAMASDSGVCGVPDNVILEGIKHPFIVTLHCAFETEERLYMVMEYVNGGELFFHVSKFGRFPEVRVQVYAGEIFLALQYLHKNGIIYRDVKLENLMLSKDGHLKIADFGLSAKVDALPNMQEQGLAGTAEYLAPEIIQGKPYSFAGDWWAYGVVTYEMLCGFHPFYTEDRQELYSNILYSSIEYPSFISPAGCDFLQKLLARNPADRLGCGSTQNAAKRHQQGQPTREVPADPEDEIRNHPFFKSIDFSLLYAKRVDPPFVPEVTDDFDTRYFDEEFLREQPEESMAYSQASKPASATAADQDDEPVSEDDVIEDQA